MRNSIMIVLSSSPVDVIEQRINKANVTPDRYVTKPPSLDEFLAVGRVIRECHDTSRVRRSQAALPGSHAASASSGVVPKFPSGSVRIVTFPRNVNSG